MFRHVMGVFMRQSTQYLTSGPQNGPLHGKCVITKLHAFMVTMADGLAIDTQLRNRCAHDSK